MTELEKLQEQEEQLAKKLAAVRARRARLEGAGKTVAVKNARPLRDILLETLAEANTPLNSLLIASVLQPLTGRAVPSTRFGTLATDEQKSFDSKSARPVYLCHCLTHDAGQAMKRYWARSDWPLEERIVGPMSGRILFLRGAAWTIALAKSAAGTAVDADRLRYVAADQARDAGLAVRRGEFPLDEWLASIGGLIDKHRANDEATRREAASVLGARLTEREQLFGARPPLMSLPGSAQGWRSARE
jgi:hypothetical protein